MGVESTPSPSITTPVDYLDYSIGTKTTITLVLSTVYERRERPAAVGAASGCAHAVYDSLQQCNPETSGRRWIIPGLIVIFYRQISPILQSS